MWDADYIPHDGGNADALAALHAHLIGMQIQILYAPKSEMPPGTYGQSYFVGDEMFIKLRQDLSINGTIEVLAHEAAHLMQPPYITRSQGDVFAAIVQAHVAHRLGVPEAASTSAFWLRQHKPSVRMALDIQGEIEHVAKMLTPGSGARLMVTR